MAALEPGKECRCDYGDSSRCPYLSEEIRDARLTDQGMREAADIKKTILKPVELVVVSPLMRTLQTATIGLLPEQPTPFLAMELIREDMGMHICNMRSPKSQLLAAFPHVDFSRIETELDVGYSMDTRETWNEMADRSYKFLEWIAGRSEKELAVVCHAGILWTMFNDVLEIDEPKVRTEFYTAEVRCLVLRFI